MLPRGLTGRIILAFVALSVALLLAVSATLFVVLRNLHEDEIKQDLGARAVAVEYAVSLQSYAQWDQAVKQVGGQIADDGGYVLVRGPGGKIRSVIGNPPSLTIPDKTGDGTTADGYIYVEPDPSGTKGFTFVFASPNTGARAALGDLGRSMLIIVLVLLAFGIPIAWLLSRSVTRPMRTLADAARDLPRGAGEPLPLAGPTEVRVLTERFNEMAHELVSTRHEESQMLANLRHDLRTPLTSIGGFAEAIADGTATGPTAISAAKTIAEEAQRLERLVGELGVVERLRQGPASLRPEALDADELLAGAAARFEGRAAGANVKLDVAGRAPGSPPLAFTGDRIAVERILQNLMENAL